MGSDKSGRCSAYPKDPRPRLATRKRKINATRQFPRCICAESLEPAYPYPVRAAPIDSGDPGQVRSGQVDVMVSSVMDVDVVVDGEMYCPNVCVCAPMDSECGGGGQRPKDGFRGSCSSGAVCGVVRG